jgi:hypothetical protein
LELGRLRPAAALLAFACVLLFPAAALAQDTGTVTIVVENGSAGAPVPEDLDVELLGFRGEVLAGTWRDFERDDQGRLSAPGLSTDPSWVYVATTSHNGLTFASPPLNLAEGPRAQALLKIFERAQSDPGALVTDYSLVLAREAGGGRIRAVHTVTFQLPGDRALAIDPPHPLLRFRLPPATTAVSALAGPATWEVAPDGSELLGGATLPPGESTFSFEYQFPWDRSGQDLDVRMPAATALLRVWGVESQVRIAAPQLVAQPGLQMNERARLAIFEGQGFAVGETVKLRISDPGYGIAERTGAALAARPAALIAVLVGLVLAAVAVAARARIRRRRLSEARELLGRAGQDPDDRRAEERLAELLADDPDLARRLRPGPHP